MTTQPTYIAALTIPNRCAAFRALLTSEAMRQVIQAYSDGSADEGMAQIAALAPHLAPWCDPSDPVSTFLAGALEVTDELSQVSESAGWSPGKAPDPFPALAGAWLALRPGSGQWSVGGSARYGTRRMEAARPAVAKAQYFARMLIGGYRYHVSDYDPAVPAEATFLALTKKVGRRFGVGMFQLANTTLDIIASGQSTPDGEVVVGIDPATMEATTAVICDSFGPENGDTTRHFFRFPEIYLLTGNHWHAIEHQDLATLCKLAYMRSEAAARKAAA